MKSIIVYKTKYGATKEYANFISEETGIDTIDVKDFQVKSISQYDKVIIGSNVRIGKIGIAKWIIKNWKQLESKKVILFTVSATPPKDEKAMKKIISDNLPENIVSKLSIFHMRGKMVLKEFKGFDKFLFGMLAKSKNKDEKIKKMLEEFNDVKRENVESLVNYLKSM